MADPLLQVRDLVVEFPTRRGTLTAVDRVTFDIAEGEGDLTKRLTVDAKGEIGELARWSNSFVEKV